MKMKLTYEELTTVKTEPDTLTDDEQMLQMQDSPHQEKPHQWIQ